MLLGDKPNDYDVYFRSLYALEQVTNYYVDKFCSLPDDMKDRVTKKKPEVQRCVWNDNKKSWRVITGTIPPDEDVRLRVFIKNYGATGISHFEEYEKHLADKKIEFPHKESIEAKSYTPVFLTSNAITLSDQVQLIMRFYGEPEKIHENYDFVHCTCYYTHHDNHLELPSKALLSILTKQLQYVGSKYPLCSLIRSRKFIQRGWNINGGQYLKMAYQINQLDLNNLHIFEEQLIGVDSTYFTNMLDLIKKEQQGNKQFNPDASYLMQLIDKVFE